MQLMMNLLYVETHLLISASVAKPALVPPTADDDFVDGTHKVNTYRKYHALFY